MKIKCTKTMTRELNKAGKTPENYSKAHFDFIAVSPELYGRMINYNIFEAYDYGDYNAATGLMQAIRVSYPGEAYACENYITTKELNKLFVSGDTLETYTARVINAYQI